MRSCLSVMFVVALIAVWMAFAAGVVAILDGAQLALRPAAVVRPARG